MRILFALAALSVSSSYILAAGSARQEQNITATIQRLFNAMSTHDAAAAGSMFMPNATLVSVAPDGIPTASPVQKWLDRVGTSKDKWLERIWNPKILQHGSIAVLWADYDFHLNGKLHHCGIDSFDLVKTSGGWKIAGVLYTTETANCPASPLGPPQ